MYSIKEQEIMNLADSYTIMYSYIVSEVLKDFGEKGDAAIRDGTRRYGKDRAITTRNKHLAVGAKINMKNLFTLFFDLPNDPRFRREKQELNTQERVSHTLVCPMADIWEKHGHMDIGRMYCEEFHFACYNNYAYGYTRVNLAKTLTQKGDAYCAFNVILRPETLPDELKPLCFEEYDSTYVEPDIKQLLPDAKSGFQLLSIKLYYHLLSACLEALGEDCLKSICKGIEKFATASCVFLKESAETHNLSMDKEWLENNFPFSINGYNSEFWKGYDQNNAEEIMTDLLKRIFADKLEITIR